MKCKHEAYEVLGGGSRRCADCGEWLSKALEPYAEAIERIAFQRGREEERREVVAWLFTRGDWIRGLRYAIERGDHLKKGGSDGY